MKNSKGRAQKKRAKKDRRRALAVAPCSAIGLARHLARELFKLGDLGAVPCHRMSFKVGKWTPDHNMERDNGGVCEDGLVNFLTERLRAYSPNKELSNSGQPKT